MLNGKKHKSIIAVSKYWPPMHVGGGEISTNYICKQLANDGNKITIITPCLGNDEDFSFIKIIPPNRLLKPFEKYYFEQIKFNEELPKGIFWGTDFYGAALLSDKNVNKIATVRDHWPICVNSLRLLRHNKICQKCNNGNVLDHYGISEININKKITRGFRAIYNRNFRKSILTKFDHVVFVSNYIAEKITSIIPLNNYSVIYNPLPQEFIRNIPVNKNINKNILYLGILKEYKGIDVLLNAMSELVSWDNEFSLTIIGEGDLKKYKNKVNNLDLNNNVVFAGKVANEKTIEFYDKSTIVVLPSLCFESFGRTIIEGMARKCVVIASNRGGPAELINNGVTGCIFEGGDFKGLAKKIIYLYKNPKLMKIIQEEGNKYALYNFLPEKIAKKYEYIFNKF